MSVKILNTPDAVLKRWEDGRPGAWNRENLVKRGKALMRYCRAIINARKRELGTHRDGMHKLRLELEKLQEITDGLDAEVAMFEGDLIDLEQRLRVALAVLTALQALKATPDPAQEIVWMRLCGQVLSDPENLELMKPGSPSEGMLDEFLSSQEEA